VHHPLTGDLHIPVRRSTDWRKVADRIGAWIRDAKQQKRQISCTPSAQTTATCGRFRSVQLTAECASRLAGSLWS
jgi:hypothetical protein